MCEHQPIVIGPDYCSAAEDEHVEGGGLLVSYNSKLGTLMDLTEETKKVVWMMSTPPPKSGFVSEATKAANASAALVNLAGKCMLHVTGRVPEPAASSESADAHGGARGVDMPLPMEKGAAAPAHPAGRCVAPSSALLTVTRNRTTLSSPPRTKPRRTSPTSRNRFGPKKFSMGLTAAWASSAQKMLRSAES